MAEGMKKIINLVKKPGDKCVILGDDGEPACVVINFQDYEQLATKLPGIGNLTEDELLEKINRDVAEWKAGQEDQLGDWQSLQSAIKDAKSRIIETKTTDNLLNEAKNQESEDKYYFEPID